MVRTHHSTTAVRFDSSRILAYSTAIALHGLALGLLLIPLSQAPIRSDTVREARWQVAEPKPVVQIQIHDPIEKEVPVTHSAPQTHQPKLAPIVVDTTSVPVFATEAVITPPSDISPVADPGPAVDTTTPPGPLQGVQLRYLKAPAPSYPREALMAGAEGTVTLRVLVGEDGSPLEVTVERSSGNRSLDAAARSQVLRRWKFQPATDNGRPVQAYGLIPVDFKLG